MCCSTNVLFVFFPPKSLRKYHPKFSKAIPQPPPNPLRVMEKMLENGFYLVLNAKNMFISFRCLFIKAGWYCTLYLFVFPSQNPGREPGQQFGNRGLKKESNGFC